MDYWSGALASSPGSPSPFLTSFRAREFYTRKFEGEGEPGTEPRPPVASWPCLVLVAMRSIVHSTTLVLPSGLCLLH